MNTYDIKVVRTRLAQRKMMLIGRWLLVKPSYKLTQQDFTHEGIHLAQQRELAYIGFYLWYTVEFIIKLMLTWKWQMAYLSVSFEQEAYENENNNEYISQRFSYQWFKYLSKT